MKQTIANITAKLPFLTTPVSKTPKGGNVFAKFVEKKVTTIQPPAIVVLHEQNGRKEYTKGTIGGRIWDVATVLQATTPNTPVTAEAVRLALPDVNAGSVSAGLSHWRKYNGKVKMQTA